MNDYEIRILDDEGSCISMCTALGDTAMHALESAIDVGFLHVPTGGMFRALVLKQISGVVFKIDVAQAE